MYGSKCLLELYLCVNICIDMARAADLMAAPNIARGAMQAVQGFVTDMVCVMPQTWFALQATGEQVQTMPIVASMNMKDV